MSRFRLRSLSERSLQAAWSQMMTANPFAYAAQTLGRDADLPPLGDILVHVLGLSGKSEAELVNYSKDMDERLNRYMDDMGLIRNSGFDLAQKEEEQSLNDFLDGATLAKDCILTEFLTRAKVDDRKEDVEKWFDAETALGKRLHHVLKNGDNEGTNNLIAKLESSFQSSNDTKPRLSRLNFLLHVDDLSLDECPALKSKSLLSLIVQTLVRPRWFYPCTSIGESRLAAIETTQGLVNLSLKLAPDAIGLLEDRIGSDLVSRLVRRQKTWPLVDDLKLDSNRTPPKMCGFLLADATFGQNSTWISKHVHTEEANQHQPITLTFARQVDHRCAARWTHDWRLVDVDGIILQDDWRRFPLLVLDDDDFPDMTI